jgi:hypothetical protein|tara:strand:+ start:7582 stop:7686 length:105 start_codon:yes stop_codon:yes gene_type:complete
MDQAIIYLLIFAGWGTLLMCGGLAVDRWEKNHGE